MSCKLLLEAEEVIFSFVGHESFCNFFFRAPAVVVSMSSKSFRIKISVADILDDLQAGLAMSLTTTSNRKLRYLRNLAILWMLSALCCIMFVLCRQRVLSLSVV